MSIVYLFAGSLTSKPWRRLANSIVGFDEPRAEGRTKRSLRILLVNLFAFRSS